MLGLLTPAPASAPASAAPALDNGAVVLRYPTFGGQADSIDSIGLPLFEQHLRALREAGYSVLPLPEILAALDQGHALPERALAITIDGASRSLHDLAWPLLRAAGLPFTVFVASGALDRRAPDAMTWDQLRALAAVEQVTIGTLGHGNGHLAALPLAEAKADIGLAQERLRAELGQTPTLFAYPNGEYGMRLRDLVVSAGFTAAFGEHSGAIARSSDRFALPRFPLSQKYGDQQRFAVVVNALPLPVEGMTPLDPLLDAGGNPPIYGFTLLDAEAGKGRLTCYHGGERLSVERLGATRIEVRFAGPFGSGRSRVNCTVPGPDGRWRWLGRQFYLPGG